MEIGREPPVQLPVNPVALIGSMVDGKPDFATVAAVGSVASNPPALVTALRPNRYSLKGIHQNMIFSVNIPSIDQIKETDYCGTISGAKADKVKDCQFSIFYGKSDKAPLIEQCPVNHALEVIEILDLRSHILIIGRVIETFASENCLTDGRPDIDKIKPLLFVSRKYYTMGQYVADNSTIYNEIKPK